MIALKATVACVSALLAPPVRAEGTGLVTNGGFEEGLLGFESHVGAAVVTDRPHSGVACLRIDGAPDDNCFAQQSVAVEGGRKYAVAVWVRSQDVPEGADCKVYWNIWAGDSLLESAAVLPRIQGTTEWTRQAVRFRAPEAATKISIILQLYKATGTVWFDDLSLTSPPTNEEGSRAAAQAAELREALRLSKSAPKVAPGIRFLSSKRFVFLCNERLALRFSGAEEGYGLRSLSDLAARRTFIVPGYETDLWRIELRPTSSFAYGGTVVFPSATPAERCSHRFDVRDGAAVLRLKWEGAPAADVEATVSLRANDFARWRLRVTSREAGQAIWLVDFPRFPALGASDERAPETEYLAIPIQQGWRWRDPRRTVGWGEGWADYPGGGKSMQFEAYCVPTGAAGGLYFATEDPACNRKTVICQARGDAFSYALRHYPPDMGRAQGYELPYPVVTGVFSGDWWDAAQTYRRWALQQPWSAAGSVRDRATPQWLRDVGVWVQGDVPGDDPAAMDAQVGRVTRFQREMGAPLAFHAYLWQSAPAHDSGYPFFLPPKPSALEFVQRLEAAGVRVVPYLNIYSGDGAGERFGAEKLLDAAMRTANGGFYGDPRGLLPMCPATTRWRELLAHEFRGTLEALPVDGLYLDQLTGAPFLCFSPDHRHPVGGGDHFYQGMRALCSEARQALTERRPDGMLFGENTSEGYNDLIDAQLPWAELYPDRNLPLFEAVYADYIIRFGLFIGRPDTWGEALGYASKLAWTFVVGQQPGWLMFGVLNEFDSPEYAPLRAMLRNLIACRLATRDFLQYGQMLRPLALDLPRRPVVWDDWSTPRHGSFPAVLNGVWRAPDGRIGVALANWTAEEQTAVLAVQREWGLQGALQVRTCLNGDWGEPQHFSEGGLPVRLPPRASVVVEFRSLLAAASTAGTSSTSAPATTRR